MLICSSRISTFLLQIIKKNQCLKEANDVADPWYTGDFEATYRDIVAGCEGLLEYLGYR